MGRQAEEDRLHVRLPFNSRISCTVLGDDVQLPRGAPAEADIIDLNDYGVRIRLRDWTVKVGDMLVLRIPVLDAGTAAPTIAQVKWVKEDMPGVTHAGLSFMF